MKRHFPEIKHFLYCETPDAWVETALKHQDIMLIDHANCEKKAAASAMTMMHRYIDKTDLLNKMSRLAREELRHFEQVLALMEQRNVHYRVVTSSRYAGKLHQQINKQEPLRLIDTLVAGAFIEARSCERFAKIAPFLDRELSKFYQSLLKSEARHFHDYLQLAYQYAQDDNYVDQRIDLFAGLDQQLVESADIEFRFHSGVVQPGKNDH